MKRALFAALVAAAIALLLPAQAAAHAFAPALLHLHEWPDGRVDLVFRVPGPAGDAGGSTAELRPLLPSRCRPLGPIEESIEPAARVERRAFDCGALGLAGEEITVRGLRENEATAVIRHEGPGGASRVFLLHGAEETVRLDPRDATAGGPWGTLRLGVEHIARGADHLLFVLCLVLLCRDARRLAAAITAFTAGHSVTLALAALGVVHVPPPPVEALIALSVVVLAARVAQRARSGRGPDRRAAWPSAFAFGLLHGLGFAGALSAARIPDDSIAPALFGFNLGVELGQLAFVAAALVLIAALERLFRTHPSWPTRALALSAGTAGGYWLLDRIAGFF
jgi:hydrogenase/urease accessory protein HupE